jgi:hypothetical protein
VLFFFKGIIIKISIINQFNVKGWNRKKNLIKKITKEKKTIKRMGIISKRKKMKDGEVEKKNSNSNMTD